MATENVKVVKIETGEAQTSVKELRSQLKQLKDTMLSLEEGTKEYNDALQQAANIQHTLKEQMEEVNASAMDFGQITGNVVKATGGIVAGFQAAQATMNLFGIENETVIKSLQKMQSLMAITQAIPAIDDGVKAFKRLGLAIKGATVGMSSLKKALISTGIGAAVVAVGALVANFDKLKAAITGTNDELEKEKKLQMDEHLKKVNDELGKRLSLEEQIRKAGGQDDLTIAEERVKSIEKEIKKKEALIEVNRRETAQAYIAYNNAVQAGKAQSYTNQLKEKAQEIGAKEEVYLKDIETIRNGQLKTAKEQLEVEKKLEAAREIKRKAEEAEKDGEERREKAIDDLKKLKESYTNLTDEIKSYNATEEDKKINDINKEEKEKVAIVQQMLKKKQISNEEAEKQITLINKHYENERLSIQKEYAELRENAAKEEAQRKREETIESIDTTYQLEQAKLQKQYDEGLISEQTFIDEKKKLLETYVKNYVNTIQLMLDTEKGLTDEQILDLTNKLNNARALLKPEEKEEKGTEGESLAKGISEAINASALALNDFSDNPAWGNILKNVATLAANWDTLHKQIGEKGPKAFSAWAQIAAIALSAVAQLMNGLAAEQDTSTKEGFEQQKKFQVAGATMSMLSGIASAWASSMKFGPITGPILGSILSAFMLATGIMQINKSKNTDMNDNGSTSSAGASPNTSAINSVIAPVQYTQDVQGASIEGAIKDTKVYVTETDISNTQNKVSVTENEARF